MKIIKKFWARVVLHYGHNRCWYHLKEYKHSCLPCYKKRKAKASIERDNMEKECKRLEDICLSQDQQQQDRLPYCRIQGITGAYILGVWCDRADITDELWASVPKPKSYRESL